jgi:ABC-type dipeptide/oligopeptide/nickel transport system permease subunit
VTPSAQLAGPDPALQFDSVSTAKPHSVLSRLLCNPMGLASIIVLAVIGLAALILPMVLPYKWDTPTQTILAPPTAQHWLGTDDSGYDIAVRLAQGARISLSVGIGVELIVVVVGTLVGLTAGYYGGRADTLLMRATDMMFAFPDILLAILIMAIRGPGMGNLFAALAVTYWAGLARLVRGQTLVLKKREFVEASRAIGTPTWQILAFHIFPNLLTPLVVASTIDIAGVIIGEATLSFLGVGLPDPMPSWGRMIANPLISGYWLGHPALVIYPAVCLTLTVLAINFLGDALRDALDPRSR